jgi:predicted component of type VI protein secretion system
MRASLIPLNGGDPIEIVRDITLIGRKEFCDVQINDPSISKVHLVVVRMDGTLFFRDMGSTNGTKVNGQRVIRGALLPNDQLTIAACKFQVHLHPDEVRSADAAAASPVSQAPPTNGSEPDIRVFTAQELAKLPPANQSVRETPDPDGSLDTDRESGAGAVLAPAPVLEPAAPSIAQKRFGSVPPPQFVD